MTFESTGPNLYDKLTLGIVKTLEKRHGICDVKLSEKPPSDKPAIISWEQKYSCMMPDDIKNFFLTSNGLSLHWNVKLNENRIPVGRMELNSLEKMVRIGGVGHMKSDKNIPSLADIDLDSDDEPETECSKPRFDHRSRVFELDPCEGWGKVCYVYRSTKPGIPAQNAEVWFLDRALQWHFLADSFLNYYRLMLSHIGLPQWQYSFTDIGLSPQAMQWFNMFSPVRLHIDGTVVDETAAREQPAPPSTSQVDFGRVFRGKSDKKKPLAGGAQNIKKRQPLPSAKSQPAGGRPLPGTTTQGKPNR